MWVGTVTPSAALTALAFALLLLNSGVAALERGDAGAAAFVAAAAVLVAALLAAVRAHELAREEEEDGRRGLRAVAWAVSAALTAMFARRVAGFAPDPAVAALVWAMGAFTVAAGGFCCLFVHDVVGGRDARPA